METPPEGKPDPTAEELANTRVPETISLSEREVFVAKIKELEAEVEKWKAKAEDAAKPKPEPKKKNVLQRFSPL